MSLRRCLAGCGLAAVAVLGNCMSEKTEPTPAAPLPLDERLGGSETRAGVITQTSELIGGVTAKARIGDLKIYNDRIAVTIAQSGFPRGYQPYGGTLLDADIIRPEGVAGKSTFGELVNALDLVVLKPNTVEVINDGQNGEPARIRAKGRPAIMPLFDALLSALFPNQDYDLDWTLDYVLEPGAEHLRLDYELFNTGRTNIDFGIPIVGFLFGDGAHPFLEGYGFDVPSSSASGDYYAAVAEDVSYLFGTPGERVNVIITQSGVTVTGAGGGITVRPREKIRLSQYLVVGDGNFSRTQANWRRISGLEVGATASGRVLDESGQPLAGARVHIVKNTESERDYVTRALTDAEGRFTMHLANGEYRAVVATDARLPGPPLPLTISGNPVDNLSLTVARPGALNYHIRDQDGTSLPAKLSIRKVEGDSQDLPNRYGEPNFSYGLFRTVFSHTGQGTLELPVGAYDIWISRGMEYEVESTRVPVPADAPVELEVTLRRIVDTTGWMSTDTHVHAQLSPDSPDLYDFKVKAMVVENLELPISTEHEAIGDFNPAIAELGLGRWMKGVIGSEVTTFTYGHFNAFPLVQDFTKPGNGRIDWVHLPPAQTFANIKANPANPFIQVNHPRGQAIGAYFTAMGYEPRDLSVTRTTEWSADFDGIEVMNGCARIVEQDTILDWFGFLNAGIHKIGTASTDNHKATPGDMGYPVTFVKMPTDAPQEAQIEDLHRSFREGRLILSCGPFINFTLNGRGIGDTATLEGDLLRLQTQLQAATWMDVDQIQIVVNGRVVKTVAVAPTDAVERFRGTLTASVTAGQDAWVALAAKGDRNHGIWARNAPSFAITNPILIDGDGDGRWTMGR